MLCQFCGKQLAEEAIFCTGCGKPLKARGEQNAKDMLEEHGNDGFLQKESKNNQKIFWQHLEPIDRWIAKHGGAKKIGYVIMPMTLAILAVIRLLGGVLCSLLLTLCNAYLIYLFYREEKNGIKR